MTFRALFTTSSSDSVLNVSVSCCKIFLIFGINKSRRISFSSIPSFEHLVLHEMIQAFLPILAIYSKSYIVRTKQFFKPICVNITISFKSILKFPRADFFEQTISFLLFLVLGKFRKLVLSERRCNLCYGPLLALFLFFLCSRAGQCPPPIYLLRLEVPYQPHLCMFWVFLFSVMVALDFFGSSSSISGFKLLLDSLLEEIGQNIS